MIKLKNILKEDPDYVEMPDGKIVSFQSEDAFTFGYHMPGMKFDIAQTANGISLSVHPKMFGSDDVKPKFLGRVWVFYKVISFWGKYPNGNELRKVLGDIQRVFKGHLKIDPIEWSIDVPLKRSSSRHAYTLVPMTEYLGAWDKKTQATIDKSKEHVLSPLQKVWKPVPDGMGSKKKIAGLTATQAHQLQRTTDEQLNEDPDNVQLGDGFELMFDAEDAWTFGIDQNTGEFKILPVEGEEDTNLHHTMFRGGPGNTKFAGRLWAKHGIISFWGKYPTPQQLRGLIKLIEKKSSVRINPKYWTVDMPEPDIKGDYLVPMEHYLQNGAPTSRPEVQSHQHEISPLKKAHKNVPKGFGSMKLKGNMPAAQYSKLRYPHVDEDNISESPERVFDRKIQIADFSDEDAYTFGYSRTNKSAGLLIGTTEEYTHYDLPRSKGKHDLFDMGRVWINKHVISFWGKYPKPNRLLQIIADIERKLKITIDTNKWIIDIPVRNKKQPLPTISQYVKPKTDFGQGEEHVAPPMVKAANKAKELAAAVTPSDKAKIKAKYAVPKGMGSMKMKGNMPAAQYSKMRYPNVDESILPSNVKYCAVVLNEKSTAALLDTLKQLLPQGWKTYAHHMTIEFGRPLRHANDKGKNVELTANEIGISDKCIAVKVSGYDSANKIPHITLAVSPDGKPKDSNDITDWQPIQPIVLYGTIEEIK